MPKLESDFQTMLIKELKRLFPGCFVIKNDPNYQQGFPDLTIFYGRQWAVLEVKRSADEGYEPNQEWFISKLNAMSFSSMICPENREDVLNALQLAFRTSR
jgi:hypothetical protein